MRTPESCAPLALLSFTNTSRESLKPAVLAGSLEVTTRSPESRVSRRRPTSVVERSPTTSTASMSASW